jgi:outer membrane receptor for ferrienterochelin and colicin
VDYEPEQTRQTLWSVYAQDEVYFLDDRLRLVAGAKVERFESTGTAFQPTLRGRPTGASIF